jgi:hypothetical protein
VNQNARAATLPIKATAFFLDNDSNRKRRTHRITALKELGLKIYPVRNVERALGRCLSRSYDLVVIGAGFAANSAVTFREELLAAKPHQKVLLVDDHSDLVGRSYSRFNDREQLRTRVEQLLAGEMSESLPLAA